MGFTLEANGWSVALRLEFRSLLQPLVRFSESSRWNRESGHGNENQTTTERKLHVKDYVNWEIRLRAGEHFSHWLSDVKKSEHWSQAAMDCLSDFTACLQDTLDLMAELEGASERSDYSYIYRPDIRGHSQNQDYYEWTNLIELCRDAWLLAAQHKPGIARLELERWKLIRFPIFRRLVFFAAANSTFVSAEEALTLLLEDQTWWLWSPETKREVFRLMVKHAPKLDQSQLVTLFNAILAGPPRSMFRDEVEESEWKELVSHEVWLRLAKLKGAGASLSREADERLIEISGQHPSWKLQPNERDEFSFRMESGSEANWRDKAVLPRKKSLLVKALVTRETKSHWYEDNWRELCQHSPYGAISALKILADQNHWPVRTWREALQVFANAELTKLSLRQLGPQLLPAPEKIIRKLSHALSWWLEVATNVVRDRRDESWLKLIDRVLDCAAAEEPVFDENPVGTAINHPVGHVAQGLISWWFRNEPKAGAGLPEPLRLRLDRMADANQVRLPHGRVIMGAHLSSLYLVDPVWTAQSVLPFFDWKAESHEARSVWEGYLWSPRLPPDLLDAFKPSFLATTDHYSELGRHNDQFASLLTIAALNLRDHFTTEELRDAFNTLPPEGLAASAKMLAQALADVGNQREEYWNHRVKPHILDVWPKSADRRSGDESRALALVCIRCGSLFPESVQTIQSLLHKTSNYDLPIMELAESDLVNRYSLPSLGLLDAIIDERYQWPPRELRQCLERIKAADPSAQSTAAYRRLMEYVERVGR